MTQPPGAGAADLAALQQDWRNRARYTLLDSHFGQGGRFQAVLQAWRSDPQRPHRLYLVSNASEALPAPWPPPTANLHALDFDDGRVRLLLMQGTSEPWRKLRQVQADTLWLDGGQIPHIQVCARLAAPGAHLRLVNASDAQREALRSAGFMPETAELWRYAPRHRAAAAPGADSEPAPGQRHAIVIGAGIAGACTAAALARQGWACTVLDAALQPAHGASGNEAAVFHGTVHGADGHHARFTRACALHAQRVHGELLARGVPGAVLGTVPGAAPGTSGGLLRAGAVDTTRPLPADWAQAWTSDDLQARRSGVQASSAWFFPGGGWVAAAAAVRALLATPGIRFQGGVAASALRRVGEQWQVLAADGHLLSSAPVVVEACAGLGAGLGVVGATAAPTQSHALLASTGAVPWPGTRARGQVTHLQHASADLPWPVTGNGYAVSLAPGRLLCGATSADDDETGDIRSSDHGYNLQRLLSLTGIEPLAGTPLGGRVGWRERTPDRLPVLGAAVHAASVHALASLPPMRHLPRCPGLYMLGALAGRGFTWGPLAGEVLASLICNTPVPLEAELLDAVDPGRFWLRQAGRSAGPASTAGRA